LLFKIINARNHCSIRVVSRSSAGRWWLGGGLKSAKVRPMCWHFQSLRRGSAGYVEIALYKYTPAACSNRLRLPSAFRMFAYKTANPVAISILPDELFWIDDVRVSPRLSLHAIHEMASAPQSIAVCATPDSDELHGAVGAFKIQQPIITIGVGGVRLR
jgi:hypothetical protein